MFRRIALLVVVVLVVGACGGDDDGATTTAASDTSAAAGATTTPDDAGDSATGSPLVIAEIDFAGDRVVLRNAGDEAYDLTGHWLCNRPTYVELPAEVLEAGATVEVAASSVGLDPAGGELGVYTERDFGNADAIVRYVAWGAAGQGRQATAAAAGIWGADDFVDNAGAAMTSEGDNPTSSSDW